MSDATVIAALIAACASVACTLINLVNSRKADAAAAAQERYQRERERQEREREQRDREREYMEVATATSMLAVLDALDVSLLALQGGHLNGNVETARESISRAKDEYQTTRSKALFAGLRDGL